MKVNRRTANVVEFNEVRSVECVFTLTIYAETIEGKYPNVFGMLVRSELDGTDFRSVEWEHEDPMQIISMVERTIGGNPPMFADVERIIWDGIAFAAHARQLYDAAREERDTAPLDYEADSRGEEIRDASDDAPETIGGAS